MGCPGEKYCCAGSNINGDEKLASTLLDSEHESYNVPVTLKMRKGWDERNLNAPACKNCRK